ncbi:hypothetical protein HY642_02440 [Candidatus Woesearchaeota archaeon]|nr:hypothetical protein [Candidatus Woesearchaeota archaeon]
MGIQITVKAVDGSAFQELKAAAARRKMTVGAALSVAIEHWLSSMRKTKGKLSDLPPAKWGRGTERTSDRIDEILYGA